ncbi:JmjC domain, hydroxylase-domain-containing protein [Linnemannia elongata]|nr:JmjC domain, hydroxylase-domain-containing protein [Linnemannia elongata]
MPLIDIKPDHYYDNAAGGIPVFCPTMEQFKDFSTFCESIVSYGREAGLVKIIPPKEWTTALPDLSERLSSVRIKTPIIQHIRGTKGIYSQTNIESRKTYTVAEFKALSNDSNHRPPSRKGVPHGPAEPLPRRKRNRKPAAVTLQTEADTMEVDSLPTTPTHQADIPDHFSNDDSHDALVPTSANTSANNSPDQPFQSTLGSDFARKHFLRQASSPSPPSRHAVSRETMSPLVPDTKDEIEATSTTQINTSNIGASSSSNGSKQKEAKAAEQEKIEPPMTDYKVEHGEDFTVDYCKEVERNYWRNLTFVQPMYGADMSGSLFDDRTTSWNTQRLGDLLCKIDQNLPGVNTPYLYFGMWKATFAWHVEDMDLYSINYLHFGAPKQWYCIRPENSSRFERIAQGIFSSDYKNCPQFLRHKTYLLSPTKLAADGVPVNRLVQHEGEFVLTFPFAYHSGYNLGFNCAESINFALDDWIPIGQKAESCRCINDAVQIDVDAIFQSAKKSIAEEESARFKSRSGKKSEDADMKDEHDQDDPPIDSQRKRKRGATKDQAPEKLHSVVLATGSKPDKATESLTTSTKGTRSQSDSSTKAPPSKKAKTATTTPEKALECVLCPNQEFDGELLPTSNGKYCHMLCAQYIPETYMSGEDDDDVIVHTEGVPAARRRLRCFVCEKKVGACVQCCKGKCIRAVHASCAEMEGMYVDEVEHDDESIEYQLYCPTHDPRQEKEKEAGYKAWKDMMAKKLKPGLSVWARWNDNVYYSGVIETILNDRLNCKIQFHDGYVKTVTWKDISLDKKQPPTGFRTAGYCRG